jgi:hypothetical protein
VSEASSTLIYSVERIVMAFGKDPLSSLYLRCWPIQRLGIAVLDSDCYDPVSSSIKISLPFRG